MTPDQWLKENDERLWLKQIKVRSGKRQCEKATGEAFTQKRFKELRDKHCELWWKEPLGRVSEARCLSEKQWRRLRLGIEAHADQIKVMSMERAARYLSKRGYQASVHLLNGSEAYRELCQ